MITKVCQIDAIKYPKYEIIEETLNETQLNFNQENNISNNCEITLHQNCISRKAKVRKCLENYRYSLEIEDQLSIQSAELVGAAISKVWKFITMDQLVPMVWEKQCQFVLTDVAQDAFNIQLTLKCKSGSVGCFNDLEHLKENKFVKLLSKPAKQDLKILNQIYFGGLFVSISPCEIDDKLISAYLSIKIVSNGKFDVWLNKSVEDKNQYNKDNLFDFAQELEDNTEEPTEEYIVTNCDEDFVGKSIKNIHIMYSSELKENSSNIYICDEEESIFSINLARQLSTFCIQNNLLNIEIYCNAVFEAETKKQCLLNPNSNLKNVCRTMFNLVTSQLSCNDYFLYVLHKSWR